MTVVGHKFYGPRIGALYRRDGTPLHPLFYGGGQERSLRPGTLNVMAIAGLGKAAELVVNNIDRYQAHMLQARQYLEDKLINEFGDKIAINGKASTASRLPNTTSVAFKDERVTGVSLLKLCTAIRASVGAACHSAATGGSSVLINSGVDPKLAARTLRLSVGRETSTRQVDVVVEELKRAVAVLTASD